jgi:photosystem II stability/assembly factor-like uncharacterized protein
VFRSSDGGLTWSLLAEALAGDTVSAVQPDPDTDSRLFATTLRFENDSAAGRLYVSEDSGTTWELREDLPGACGGSFAFGGAIYLTAFCSNAIYASFDHGASWIERSSPAPSVLRLQATSDGTLYATALDGVFRSRDAAGTWEIVTGLPPGCGEATIRAFVPDEDERVLVVGAVNEGYNYFQCGGLFRSEDAGSTWSFTLDQRRITDLIRDPRVSTRLFTGASRSAGFFGQVVGGVFQSDDGGRTWRSLGLPTADAGQVVISSDGRRLYALTPSGLFVLPIRRPIALPLR